MTPEQKQKLEEAILADLRDPSLTHMMIAIKHRVGTVRVQELGKKHGLQRKRGRRLGDRFATRYEVK